MVSKPVAISMVVLRVLALAASFVAVVVIATDNFNIIDDTKVKFQKLKSYRFVLAIAVICVAYGLVQLPFAIFYAIKLKRLISDRFSREFDFYGDKVISILMALGSGVGFAASIEDKNLFDKLFDYEGVPKDSPIRHRIDKFLIRGIIASSILCLALFSMTVLSVLSSINRSKN